MKVAPTKLPGVLIIEPDVYTDERGFFQETYHRTRFSSQTGLDIEFVQDNHSRSSQNVIRGLHFQLNKPQGKLIRISSGSIWDVAVDIDPTSPTFKQWLGVELNDTNHKQLYLPPGYAHGFCVLSVQADLLYKCTKYYDRADERGIAWNDKELNIDWPVSDPVVSERDQNSPTLSTFLAQK